MAIKSPFEFIMAIITTTDFKLIPVIHNLKSNIKKSNLMTRVVKFDGH